MKLIAGGLRKAACCSHIMRGGKPKVGTEILVGKPPVNIEQLNTN